MIAPDNFLSNLIEHKFVFWFISFALSQTSIRFYSTLAIFQFRDFWYYQGSWKI